MKNFLFQLLFFLVANLPLTAQISSPTAVDLNNPFITNYNISGSSLQKMNVVLTTTGNYANFTLYADNQIVADNLNVPAAGTYNLDILVKFPSTGNTELKLVATGSDITVESLTLTNYSGVSFPDFYNATAGVGIVDEPSLKYGGPTIADFNNDGHYDIVLNNHNDSPSKLYMNTGGGSFVKQNPDLALWDMMDLHGSAAGDYDNDGDLDLLMTLGGGNGANPTLPVLYRNDNGTLVRNETAAGITSGARGRSPRWSDMDMDGDLDLMLFNAEGINGGNGEQHIFYENLGNGTFNIKRIAGLENAGGEKLLLTDFNNDHIDDVVLFSPLSIWRGNGDFTFSQVSSGASGAYGIVAATDIDIDNDGDLDLYLARGEYYFTLAEQNAVDFYPLTEKLDMRVSGSQGILPFEINAAESITISGYDHLKRNGYEDGFPVFLGSALQQNIMANPDAELVITQTMADGWSTTRTNNGLYIGHLGNGVWKVEVVRNQDIYWSIHFTLDGVNGFTPTGWTPNNRNAQDILLQNNNGSFSDVSDQYNIPIGGNHWGVTTGDFNNDSYPDLYVHRFGYLRNRLSDYLMLNTGQGSFEITTSHGAQNAGALNHGDMGQAFDSDLDGKVDILNGDDELGLWHLYKNGTTNMGNYVLVRVGYSPASNVDPISAEVTVYTSSGQYFKRVSSAGAAHSQSLLNTIHFGLGATSGIDSIAVRWRNGETYVMRQLVANNLYYTDNIEPATITVSPSITNVAPGGTIQLIAEITPGNANMEVTWTSSDPAAVSVDANGLSTGNIAGESAIITATTALGGLVGSATVTVCGAPTANHCAAGEVEIFFNLTGTNLGLKPRILIDNDKNGSYEQVVFMYDAAKTNNNTGDGWYQASICLPEDSQVWYRYADGAGNWENLIPAFSANSACANSWPTNPCASCPIRTNGSAAWAHRFVTVGTTSLNVHETIGECPSAMSNENFTQYENRNIQVWPNQQGLATATDKTTNPNGWVTFWNNNNTTTDFSDDFILFSIEDFDENLYYDLASVKTPNTGLAQWHTNDPNTFINNAAQGSAIMARYWNFLWPDALSDEVGVRFYYTPEEVVAMNDVITNNFGGQALVDESEMNLYKVTSGESPGYIPDLSFDDVLILKYNNGATSTTEFDYGSLNCPSVVNYFEFKVAGFSGGSGGGTSAGASFFNAALPVELIEFTGREINKNTELKWTTASEIDHDFFEIQHSHDGRNFYPIGKVQGKGSPTELTNYKFNHQNPFSGINYYRLSSVAFNGTVEQSQIISVSFKSDNKVVVFPSIVSNDYLNIRYQGEEVSTVIYTQSGKILAEQTLDMSSGKNIINVAKLPSGIYYLLVKDKYLCETVKFIIHQ